MIDFYTWTTPNGYKVAIALEELALDYDVRPVDIASGAQNKPTYLSINPNGKIPTIVDRGNDDFMVFESGAILVYLAELAGKLLPAGRKQRSVVLQWLMFQVGGLGPMQGQAHVFHRYFDEKIPAAISRYQNETRRLYDVLNTRLATEEYLAGDYSIADIATFPWVRGHDWAGVSLDGLDNLSRWVDEMAGRPAVVRGLKIPDRKAESDDTKISAIRGIVGQ